jgi:hypothetical protein
MMLKQVHEYAVDRATMMARRGVTHPTRKYVNELHLPITVQSDASGSDIRFFDQGGNEMDVADVPQHILDDLQKNPVRVGGDTVEQVLKFCPFCPHDSNAIASGAYAAHLEEHIREERIDPGDAVKVIEAAAAKETLVEKRSK